jgi:hypothetical protein
VSLSAIKSQPDTGEERTGAPQVLRTLRSAVAEPGHPQSSPDGGLIDLTDTYKLTSTGMVEDRAYATIDRQTYHTGDCLSGMVITAIKSDRVYLEERRDGRRFIIVFPYKKR